MKVLLLNGSPNEFGCTYTALTEAATALEARGIETELIWLGKKPVAGCIECLKCKEGSACVFDDAVNDIAGRIDTFDALIAGSPVYYGGPTGQICAFLDRLFMVTGRRMAGKAAAAVVSCRRGGATAAFERLNQYFLMNNMLVVGSQYWNQVHGYTPQEVRQDEEGLQTMRTLAVNMAWLLHSIEAGRAAGLPAPEYEPLTATNFIR